MSYHRNSFIPLRKCWIVIITTKCNKSEIIFNLFLHSLHNLQLKKTNCYSLCFHPLSSLCSCFPSNSTSLYHKSLIYFNVVNVNIELNWIELYFHCYTAIHVHLLLKNGSSPCRTKSDKSLGELTFILSWREFKF
jgi:hypothetical protein